MPTYAWLARFRADFERLTPAQQAAFLVAVEGEPHVVWRRVGTHSIFKHP